MSAVRSLGSSPWGSGDGCSDVRLVSDTAEQVHKLFRRRHERGVIGGTSPRRAPTSAPSESRLERGFSCGRCVARGREVEGRRGLAIDTDLPRCADTATSLDVRSSAQIVASIPAVWGGQPREFGDAHLGAFQGLSRDNERGALAGSHDIRGFISPAQAANLVSGGRRGLQGLAGTGARATSGGLAHRGGGS